MAEVTQNIPTVAGVTPQAFIARLDAQRTPVRGIFVDNSNSDVDVLIYPGVAPQGQPILVIAGSMRALPYSGTSALYVTFYGVPQSAGSIYLHFSDSPVAAANDIVKKVSVVGPVPVTIGNPVTVVPGGTFPVDGSGGSFPVTAPAGGLPVDGSGHTQPISGNVGIPGGVAITAQPDVNQASQYPAGATPFSARIYATAIGGGAVTLASVPGTNGQTFYLQFLRMNGLNAQATTWYLSPLGVFAAPLGTAPAGIGDVADAYLALPFSTFIANGNGIIAFNTPDTILGEVNVSGYLGGYVL